MKIKIGWRDRDIYLEGKWVKSKVASPKFICEVCGKESYIEAEISSCEADHKETAKES